VTYLELRNVHAGYGVNEVLRGIDLEVGRGEFHLITGHNGAGKTTLLRTIHGLVKLSAGTIRLGDLEVVRMSTADRVAAGVAYIPQERAIFPSLTVRENIRCGLLQSARERDLQESIERVQRILPEIESILDRRAGLLSGGQQRICALGRAVAHAPQLLLLDEPSVGLSPVLARRVIDAAVDARNQFGVTVVLAEQNLADAAPVADMVHVLRDGRIFLTESGPEFLTRTDWVSLF
jgi:branched-chain amino acid transport system ATP-binding protein